MSVSIVAVAGKPTRWVDQATARYSERMPRHWRFGIDLIAPSRKNDSAARMADEWRRVEQRVPSQHTLALLDERGKQMTSRQFAQWLQRDLDRGASVSFVIGGADGVSHETRQNADTLLAVAPFTLPHELARVVLVEQIYRAHTIMTNHPYHRD
ncbi:MAG: 23S rRNA (pseudouridine(1915)-N(3))-methyltransferase RlmH [Pseudomonadota bacterium]